MANHADWMILCVFNFKVSLLLQVDNCWGEKGSECICKGNLEPR